MNSEDFTRLENKVDALTKIMEEINEKLNQVTIIARAPIAPRPMPDMEQAMQAVVQRRRLLIDHGYRLQKQFNLKQPPHENRILAFLKTQDPKVFDGLMRN